MKFKESSGGSGINFLKLKSGQSVNGVLRGEPYDFQQHWIEKKPYDCTGESCERCAKGDKSKFRFRLNIIINEEGKYVSKIFEQGWKVYEILRKLSISGYDLEKIVVSISRVGEGLQTVFSVLPVPPPNGTVSAEKEEILKRVALLDLVNPPVDEPEEKDEVPF